ncbi:MAG: magnesium chelatase domain-containing protein, partial [Candidatus Eremiobacterota bacterium]
DSQIPPARRAVGLDPNRLSLLLAVISKRCKGLSVGNADVYANVAGGLRLSEPALDLALTLAVASSLNERPLDSGLAAMGEVGLGGEIRVVTQVEARLRELAKLGFTRALIPRGNLEGLDVQGLGSLRVTGVDSLLTALAQVGIDVNSSEPDAASPHRKRPRPTRHPAGGTACGTACGTAAPEDLPDEAWATPTPW